MGPTMMANRAPAMDVRLRMLRERERDRILDIQLVGTKDQLADTFTKQLCVKDHVNFRDALLRGGSLG